MTQLKENPRLAGPGLATTYLESSEYMLPGTDPDVNNVPFNIGVNTTGIPDELKHHPHWVLWKYAQRDGKWTKVPYNPRTGTKAAATDSTTWGAFEAVVTTYGDGHRGFDGIGFVLTRELGISVLDQDKCNGEPWATDMQRRLNSFTEWSPSGNGYHVWVMADVSGFACKKGKHFHNSKAELYGDQRFITVTGVSPTDLPPTIEHRQAELEDVCKPLRDGPPPNNPPLPAPMPSTVVRMPDSQALDVLKRVKPKGYAVFTDGTAAADSKDHSAADLSLCNDLAWVTGGNHEQIDRLFRQSALMRDKWDSRRGASTYGRQTIDKAVAETPGAYNPGPAPAEAFGAGAAVEPLPLHQPMPEHSWHVLHTKTNGNPLGTFENFMLMMKWYGVTIRYNAISKRDEIFVPGQTTTVDNRDAVRLSALESTAVLNQFPVVNHNKGHILRAADSNPHNPVLDWMQSRPWDGRDRLPELTDSLQTPTTFNQSLKATLLRKWLISAAAAVAKPEGFHARGVLTLTGEQGKGKTSWFRNLLPDSLSEYFGSGSLDPADKDSVATAISNWIFELGELDGTFRKADMARLKDFITKTVDKFRRPYAAGDSTMPRRTVFCASVNDNQFLVDTTGNSRFWTIPVVAIRYGQPVEDIQQLWAQVLHLFHQGEQWWLTPEDEDALSQSNTEFEEVDPLEEKLLATYSIEAPRCDKLTASGVLSGLGISNPNRAQATRMGKVLRKYFDPLPRTGRGQFYMMPKRNMSFDPGFGR